MGFDFSMSALARASAANKYESKYYDKRERRAQALVNRRNSVINEWLAECVALRHESTVTDA